MRENIRVGLIGLGTVGTGVFRLLTENADLIRRRLGAAIEIVQIADIDLQRRRDIATPRELMTTDAAAVVERQDVDIVVELIGGINAARDLILQAIRNGKHVVTANKALLAEHGEPIHAAALEAGVDIGFEASVGGGIPVIKALKDSFAANHILSIYGIINGTSNYILTKMTEEERTFSDVLAEAQRAGYAEADPTFDVGGIDSAHKLAILARLAFGTLVSMEQIYTSGITEISPVDIEFGREFGYKLKLLAIAKVRDGALEARVHPTMVPDEYPIAQVSGVYNAIQIVGDACEDIMLYGKGAGSLPTASAVVSDIIDISRGIFTGSANRVPALSYQHDARRVVHIKPVEEITSLYYLRFMTIDKPGVLSQVSGILGNYNISIASVIQRGRQKEGAVPLVITTHTAVERDVRQALVEIDRLSCVAEKTVLIRVEGEE